MDDDDADVERQSSSPSSVLGEKLLQRDELEEAPRPVLEQISTASPVTKNESTALVAEASTPNPKPPTENSNEKVLPMSNVQETLQEICLRSCLSSGLGSCLKACLGLSKMLSKIVHKFVHKFVQGSIHRIVSG